VPEGPAEEHDAAPAETGVALLAGTPVNIQDDYLCLELASCGSVLGLPTPEDGPVLQLVVQ